MRTLPLSTGRPLHRRRREREADTGGARVLAVGGRYAPLDPEAVLAIERAALDILADTGLSDAPPGVVELVQAAGGELSAAGRLLFPQALVRRCLDALPREVMLCGQDPRHDMALTVAGYTWAPEARRR